MEHYAVTFQPEGRTVSVHAGATVLEAAGQAGIVLNTTCGGAGTCGKCAVTVQPATQPTAKPVTKSTVQPASRTILACQHRIDSDITVFVPPSARFYHQQILHHGIDRQVMLCPSVRKIFVNPPTNDLAALQSALETAWPDCRFNLDIRHGGRGEQGGQEGRGALDGTSPLSGITAVCHFVAASEQMAGETPDYNVTALEQGDTAGKLYGVAVDIGTTTVVARLIDMTDANADINVTATAAMSNPQIRYGDDVVSRISFSQTDMGAEKLNTAIIDSLNDLLGDLAGQADIDLADIYELAVAGNTTMTHLLLNFPVVQLGQAPYKAHCLDAQTRRAVDMGLKINPAGSVYVMPNIAGFVGADTTAVALAVGMDDQTLTTLVVDIGTNGELIIGTKDKMYAASCAAGPALEGARISCGSRAVEGAIEAVVIADNDIDVDVIGGGPARWICGSGLIDAIAVMLDLGVIDNTGRIISPQDAADRLSPAILARVTERDGQMAFVIAHNPADDDESVILTQRDIREAQLAKAAIRAGIDILLTRIGADCDSLAQLLLAGAFGNYIRRESVLRIGLLPPVALEKIHFVGNAAAGGAQMTLLSSRCRILAADLARQIEYVELAHQADFQSAYADAMLF